VCLTDDGRAALVRGLATHFPGFPSDVKPYRWKQVTQVDLRTVKRMLSPGETVRQASVLTVFSDLGVSFDNEAYLAPSMHDENTQPATNPVLGSSSKQPHSSWRLTQLVQIIVTAIFALTIALVAVNRIHRPIREGVATHAGSAPKQERWMVLYDDFTRDTALDPQEWLVNGPAARASLIGHASVVSPRIAFDQSNGLCMSGIDANNQQAGVQTLQKFTPPFTVTAEGMTTQAHAGALLLSIASATGKSGMGIIGGQGTTDQDTGFVYTSPQGGGGSWDVRGRLSPIPPDADVWYTLAIRVDAAGNATVATSSGDHILGQATRYAGAGPFYVILGQNATSQQDPGPNQACWLALQVIHG